MVKIQYNKHTNQHSITIPRELMKLKKWCKGQTLHYAVNNRTLEVSLLTIQERVLK